MKKSDLKLLNKISTHKEAIEKLTCDSKAGDKYVFTASEYIKTFTKQIDAARTLKKSTPHINQILKSHNQYYVVCDNESAKLFREVISKDKNLN